MTKNATALILIVLAVGIYFTFTSSKLDELKAIKSVNAEYKQAIDNANELINIRDKVLQEDINISEEDNIRLNKILPDNVDNVRLIIDVKDNIAANHGLFLRSIRTTSPEDLPQSSTEGLPLENSIPNEYGTVSLSFSVTTSYKTFINFLKDLEASLRVMDISSLSISAGDNPGLYDFSIEIKTYWLKQ